jgi:hypothetical protein
MKKAVFALAAVLALVLTASALGDDFSQGKGAKAAPNWKVLSLGSSGQPFTSKPARRARAQGRFVMKRVRSARMLCNY